MTEQFVVYAFRETPSDNQASPRPVPLVGA